jgi:hypothetical protein
VKQDKQKIYCKERIIILEKLLLIIVNNSENIDNNNNILKIFVVIIEDMKVNQWKFQLYISSLNSKKN